jgi:hypothetical protein
MMEPNAGCPTEQNSCLTFLQLARKVSTISLGQVVVSGSYNYGSDACGTALAALCLLQMETLDQYREYAAECFRLASKSKTEADEKTLLEIARAWEKLAEEAEAES